MVTKLVPFIVKAAGQSDVGLVRENNEDSWKVIPEKNVYVLADGMGGHKAGEIASKTAVDSYSDSIESHSIDLGSVPFVSEFLLKIIKSVNQSVYKMAQSDRDLRGMGTTLCSVIFTPEAVVYAHVGDSRIYCFRDHKLKQLTEDHSLVQELLDLGELSSRQARGHHQRNIITKAIGTEPSVEPSLHTCDVQAGDLFLMCSDGLTDLMSNREVEKILTLTAPISQKVELMIQSANRRGGQDNITVILMEVMPSELKHLSRS